MPLEEFALFLLGLIVVALSSSMFVSAQSSDPQKVFVITSVISFALVSVVAIIGAACYVIAWLWRNPMVSVGLLILVGLLIYLESRRTNVLSQGEKR